MISLRPFYKVGDMESKTANIRSQIVFAILFICFLGLLYFSREVVLIALIGVGIGALIAPVLKYMLHRFKIPRVFSALLVFVGLCLIFLFVSAGLLYVVSDQVKSLSERAPELIKNLQSRVSVLFAQYPWVENQVKEFNAANAAQVSLGQILLGLQVGFLSISGIVFSVILGIYTSIESENYFESVVRAFPLRLRLKARHVLIRCAQVLRQWFKAQLISMGVIGAITAIGLWIAHVDYWAVFGLLTAVLGIVPYVGIIIVVVCASLITLASDPSLVPWVILVFLITQQIEGNIVLPMVMRGQVELPEVPLLIFILFMGAWFGLIGVFIAPPVFAVLRVIYLMTYIPRIEKN